MSTPSSYQIDTLRQSIDALVRVFRITDSPVLDAVTPKLNPPDVQALLFISRNPGCIASEIGVFLGVVPTTTSALVDRLVRHGLVHRARSESNRRVVPLQLTENGVRVSEQIISQQNEHCRIMLNTLTASERTAFLSAAKKIASSIS